ncbi:MAG: C25 family cysteine peptidase [Petrotogales bacterium]
MKRIIPMLLIVTLISVGFRALATPENNYETIENIESISLSEITLKENENNKYTLIELKESTSQLMKTSEPMLPVINKNYVFPLGTKIKQVNIVFSGVKEHVLAKKIMPAPAPVTTNKNIEAEEIKEKKEVYAQGKLYPAKHYKYSIHAGLNGKKHVMILNLRCFPIQYNPNKNTIYAADTMEIEVTYELPQYPTTFSDKYALVIIAPKKFETQLQPLIDHKNNYGINTTLKTTEEIYAEFEGRDQPEQIKHFIKYAVEEMGAHYVLLVGGIKSLFFGTPRDDHSQGSKSWHVPVRYTNLYDDGGIYDPGYISDLYYADIYKVVDGKIVFDDWDSNGNNIFGEWKGVNKDVIDHYPDVYIGRLACRNSFEVKVMVNKIVNYERTAADPSWFNKIIVVGGDSHNDPGTDYIEGEMVCDKAISYMSDFEPVKIYASNRDASGATPTPKNISKEISKGAGFILFDGHGNPGSWDTHWCREYSWENSPGGISIARFPILSNREKLPIALVGGCHNSQFNVTLFATLLKKPYMWTYGLPVPECFSWWLTRKIGGGSIATMGSTGLGYGYVGNHSDIDGDGLDEPDTLEGLGGYTEVMFFKVYNEGVNILGEVWGTTIANYLDVFPPMEDKIQMKSIQEWVLLGDPSLKIGGYTE